jgi:hypothetical protein
MVKVGELLEPRVQEWIALKLDHLNWLPPALYANHMTRHPMCHRSSSDRSDPLDLAHRKDFLSKDDAEANLRVFDYKRERSTIATIKAPHRARSAPVNTRRGAIGISILTKPRAATRIPARIKSAANIRNSPLLEALIRYAWVVMVDPGVRFVMMRFSYAVFLPQPVITGGPE